MLLIIEGLALCFILLMICVVGTANGPVGCVYFYEPEVQERWDIALTIRLIPEWYTRLMNTKFDQEKNIKTSDVAKSAGNEGIQG
mgnify:CR=1 FL=1